MRIRPEDLSQPQPTAGPASELTGIEAAEIGILKLWYERRASLAAGETGAADQAVRVMLALMESQGIRSMEVLAGAFAHEGYAHLRDGNYLRASESFGHALQFDPSLPHAYAGLADARRLAGEGFLAYGQERLRGLQAGLSNFWYSYAVVSNLLLILLASAALSGAAFTAAMAVRYLGAWRHDVAESLSARGFAEPVARLLGSVVVVLPLVVWLSGIWLLLWWAGGTFRYLRRGERIVAFGALLLAGALVPAVAFALSVYRVTGSDTMKATVSALRGGYEPEKARFIQEVLKQRPDDPTFHFLLASVLKDGGYYVEAFQHYQRVWELAPDHYRAYNNVGNIYFATGQYGQAVNWFRRATDANPQFAIGYFNAYLAQQKQTHFTEADESLQRARTLDAEAVAAYLARGGDLAATPVDAKIPMSEAWLEVMRQGGRPRPGGSAGVPWQARWANPVTLGAGGALALGLASLFLRRGRRARACPRCGRAFCDRCQRDGSGFDTCAQCAHLLLRRQDLSPEVRAQKQAQVARHGRATAISRRLASLLWPGTGMLLGGRVGRGTVLCFAWALAGLGLLARERLLGFPAAPFVSGGAAAAWALGGVLAVIWAAGNLLTPADREPGRG